MQEQVQDSGPRPNRAIRRKLAACRGSAQSGPGRAVTEYDRPVSPFAFRAENRGDKGGSIMAILLGLLFAAATASVFILNGPEGVEPSAYLGGGACVLLGLAIAFSGMNGLAFREAVSIENDTVRFSRKSLVSRHGFTEPLDAYLCVLPSARMAGGRHEQHRLDFFARLVHRSRDDKSVSLYVRAQDALSMLTEGAVERKPYEELARALCLPLATVQSDGGCQFRLPEELDLSLARRSAKAAGLSPANGRGGAAERPVDPGSPPKGRCKVSLKPDGFNACRTHRYFMFIALLFGVAAAIALLYLRNEGQGPLALVLSIFCAIMLASSLTSVHLELAGDTLTSYSKILGRRFYGQSLKLGDIEELVDGRDERMQCRALIIASDEVTLTWAHRCGDAEITWFKNAIESRLP